MRKENLKKESTGNDGYEKACAELYEQRVGEKLDLEKRQKERIAKIKQKQLERYRSKAVRAEEIFKHVENKGLKVAEVDWSFIPAELPDNKDQLKWLLIQIMDIIKQYPKEIIKGNKILNEIKKKLS